MRFTICDQPYDVGMVSTTQTRGQLLQRLRKKRGVSQTELANAIGIKTQGTISAWENDRQEIDHDHLLKLAQYFRVDPALLGYEVPHVVDMRDVRELLDDMERRREEQARVRHEEIREDLRQIRLRLPR